MTLNIFKKCAHRYFVDAPASDVPAVRDSFVKKLIKKGYTVYVDNKSCKVEGVKYFTLPNNSGDAYDLLTELSRNVKKPIFIINEMALYSLAPLLRSELTYFLTEAHRIGVDAYLFTRNSKISERMKAVSHRKRFTRNIYVYE